jgi:predicted NUDIX family NTP pyrophosphohydrolase
MATKSSAGLLLYRFVSNGVEVLLGHMGGPYWARKNEHAWSIPKGEYDVTEDPFTAAGREFAEELGSSAPNVDYVDLGTIKSSGKQVRIWAGMADFDASSAVSNTFELEWPPRSGQLQSFPELDRIEWVMVAAASTLLVKGQLPFLNRLNEKLG